MAGLQSNGSAVKRVFEKLNTSEFHTRVINNQHWIFTITDDASDISKEMNERIKQVVGDDRLICVRIIDIVTKKHEYVVRHNMKDVPVKILKQAGVEVLDCLHDCVVVRTSTFNTEYLLPLARKWGVSWKLEHDGTRVIIQVNPVNPAEKH